MNDKHIGEFVKIMNRRALYLTFFPVALLNCIYITMFCFVMAGYNEVNSWMEVIADLSESNVNIRDIGVIRNLVYIDTTTTIGNRTINLMLSYPPPPQNLNIKSNDDINRWIAAMRSPTNVLAKIPDIFDNSNSVYQAYSEPIIITWWVVFMALLLFFDFSFGVYTWIKLTT